ncbi:SGF29 C-terminal domain-containing protein [Mycena indigotica]|uniref:SGF29 C-terminal domain-containing protein n=1 Tax=Mycena indigotica TaxID=2126181 RepID=A0A8H6VX73_9AGAR|nr:SGF29 C-terminal domain-containing protein [Mycena indigotica]KAF7297389.1 SGF29 C-terminal domain-containing protein [Mycena indigotica]
MDRRRGAVRPASSEEVQCWSHAAKSLSALSTLYAHNTQNDTVGRVNRLSYVWPVDGTMPPQGFDEVKRIYRKLNSGLEEIQRSSDQEVKAIEEAIERLDVLIGLRKAPEPADKRTKRPKIPSPSLPPAVAPIAPAPTVSVPTRISITVPARASVGPPAAPAPPTRVPKGKKEGILAQLPLLPGRKVAFYPPLGKLIGPSSVKPPASDAPTIDTGENSWILAVVVRCLSADKTRQAHSLFSKLADSARVKIRGPGPGASRKRPARTVIRLIFSLSLSLSLSYYHTSLKGIIPLPDPMADEKSPTHINAYQEFVQGAAVMALYPDTSCFYRAEVVATPKQLARTNPTAKHVYKLKFEDDDNQEHSVPAEWVVEWPNLKSV